MGIDWWEHDPSLSSGQRDLVHENRRLERKVRELESGSAETPLNAEEDEERRGG
jgi:hypothetical protein